MTVHDKTHERTAMKIRKMSNVKGFRNAWAIIPEGTDVPVSTWVTKRAAVDELNRLNLQLELANERLSCHEHPAYRGLRAPRRVDCDCPSVYERRRNAKAEED